MYDLNNQTVRLHCCLISNIHAPAGRTEVRVPRTQYCMPAFTPFTPVQAEPVSHTGSLLCHFVVAVTVELSVWQPFTRDNLDRMSSKVLQRRPYKQRLMEGPIRNNLIDM